MTQRLGGAGNGTWPRCGPEDCDVTEAQDGPCVDGTDPTAVCIGLDAGEPFGLVQVYRFARSQGRWPS